MKKFPPMAIELCRKLDAPPRLVKHLELVHSACHDLCGRFNKHWPGIVDEEKACLGAAIHDMGKCIHPRELEETGCMHEKDGPSLLRRNGVDPAIADFARSHGQWDDLSSIEALVVALADNCWRGRRNDKLESQIVTRVSTKTSLPSWKVLMTVDDIASSVAKDGDLRLQEAR